MDILNFGLARQSPTTKHYYGQLHHPNLPSRLIVHPPHRRSSVIWLNKHSIGFDLNFRVFHLLDRLATSPSTKSRPFSRLVDTHPCLKITSTNRTSLKVDLFSYFLPELLAPVTSIIFN